MINIFVADDSIAYRDRIERRLLERPNFKIVGLTRLNGDVFQLVRERKPDVLILDLSCGGQAGFDVLSKLLSESNWKIYVIGLMNAPNLAINAWALGCNEIVFKDSPASGSLVEDCDRIAFKICEMIDRKGFE